MLRFLLLAAIGFVASGPIQYALSLHRWRGGRAAMEDEPGTYCTDGEKRSLHAKRNHFMGSASLFFGRLVVVAAGGSALRSSDPRRGLSANRAPAGPRRDATADGMSCPG